MNSPTELEIVNRAFMVFVKEASVGPAQLLDFVKSAALVSVSISDSCPECKGIVSVSSSDLYSAKDAVCPNCGHKSMMLMSDRHRNNLIDEAVRATDTDATQPQRLAGNYRKGKFAWHELVIALENPKDSIRRGVSKAGKMWETKLVDHYGYILKHVSEADGDHMDVFVSSEPDHANTSVYVIDQSVDGKFDEHKCVILAKDAKAAKAIYKRNYQDDWKGFDNLSTLSLSEFKDWLVNGDTSKPLFEAVPESDIAAVKAAKEKIEAEVKKIDPTGDDSGSYGHIVLCRRQKKGWIITGDWWSNKVCDVYKSELKKALPDYEWEGSPEHLPTGYEPENMGDWYKLSG